MILQCLDCIEKHFNKDFVWEEKEKVEIIETDPAGRGTASFSVGNTAIVIKAQRQAPLVWALLKRKCADGSFVTFDGDKAHLHVVELKSKLTQSTWTDTVDQLEGMFLTALAASRLLQIQNFESVTCYIAYKQDRMDPGATANPSLLKTLVGETQLLGEGAAWKNELIQLPFNVSAKLKKAQRDAAGNADFGSVH